ncbi:hypothetical protein ACWDA7_29305 [Streptomyces sp. NPDC001156]
MNPFAEEEAPARAIVLAGTLILPAQKWFWAGQREHALRAGQF